MNAWIFKFWSFDPTYIAHIIFLHRHVASRNTQTGNIDMLLSSVNRPASECWVCSGALETQLTAIWKVSVLTNSDVNMWVLAPILREYTIWVLRIFASEKHQGSFIWLLTSAKDNAGNWKSTNQNPEVTDSTDGCIRGMNPTPVLVWVQRKCTCYRI